MGTGQNAQVIPDWIGEYIQEWQRKLYLHEWKIKVCLSPHPGNDNADQPNMACVYLYPEILVANLEIRNDVPEEATGEWQQTIIHELLHVRLARITDYVEKDLLPELSPSARSIAEKTFRREVEPVIEILACAWLNQD